MQLFLGLTKCDDTFHLFADGFSGEGQEIQEKGDGKPHAYIIPAVSVRVLSCTPLFEAQMHAWEILRWSC